MSCGSLARSAASLAGSTATHRCVDARAASGKGARRDDNAAFAARIFDACASRFVSLVSFPGSGARASAPSPPRASHSAASTLGAPGAPGARAHAPRRASASGGTTRISPPQSHTRLAAVSGLSQRGRWNAVSMSRNSPSSSQTRAASAGKARVSSRSIHTMNHSSSTLSPKRVTPARCAGAPPRDVPGGVAATTSSWNGSFCQMYPSTWGSRCDMHAARVASSASAMDAASSGSAADSRDERATASDGSVPKIWYRAQSGSDAEARDMASIAAPRVRGGGAPLGAAPGRVPLEGNLGNR